MQRKRQFQTAQQRRTFFDRKVRTIGYSRTISMGKIIPPDWTYARVTILSKDAGKIVVELAKLLGDEPLAHNPKANPNSRPNP